MVEKIWTKYLLTQCKGSKFWKVITHLKWSFRSWKLFVYVILSTCTLWAANNKKMIIELSRFVLVSEQCGLVCYRVLKIILFLSHFWTPLSQGNDSWNTFHWSKTLSIHWKSLQKRESDSWESLLVKLYKCFVIGICTVDLISKYKICWSNAENDIWITIVILTVDPNTILINLQYYCLDWLIG